MNRVVVASTGEGHFLRDPGLLDSALARPQNAFAYGEEDIVALAVRLLAGVAQAHAKRTLFACFGRSSSPLADAKPENKGLASDRLCR